MSHQPIPQKVLERIIFLLICAVLMLFYLVAQKMGYEDMIMLQDLYEENVCTGVHPDYKKLGINCTEYGNE